MTERGRPSTYTQEAADEICERLSTGEPLAVICRDDHMPAYRTVYTWGESRPEFSASIARAREEGFDAIALDCLHIADETGKDTKVIKRQDGSEAEVCDSEWISRSKLRVETRLKLLAKWSPKKYGERVEVEHSGHIDSMTPEARQAEIDRLLAKHRAADAE